MDKRVSRFLCRKNVVEILGKEFPLHNKYINDLCKIFDIYGYRQIEDDFKSLAEMISNNTSFIFCRYRKLKKISQYDKRSLMLRYGKNYKNKHFLITQNRKKGFKNTPEYWKSIGITDVDEIKQNISKIQTSRSLKSAKKLTGTSEYTCRSVTYWLKLGLTLEEANEKVRQIQTNNGIRYYLSKCISLEDAQIIQNKRNENWLLTLQSKSEEEKQLIVLKQGHSIESYIARGYSPEIALKKSLEYYKKRNNYSIISQELFSLLDNRLGDNYITYYKTKNHEFQINGKNVDFYCKTTKTVIEFYGDWWHMNPSRYKETDVNYNMTAKEIWDRDSYRINQIKESTNVNNVIIVWESDYRKNPTKIIDTLKECIWTTSKQ